jgi:hypothetical protein
MQISRVLARAAVAVFLPGNAIAGTSEDCAASGDQRNKRDTGFRESRPHAVPPPCWLSRSSTHQSARWCVSPCVPSRAPAGKLPTIFVLCWAIARVVRVRVAIQSSQSAGTKRRPDTAPFGPASHHADRPAHAERHRKRGTV